MNRRPILLVLVLLASVLAVVGLAKCGRDGPGKGEGTKRAAAARAAAGAAYWKARGALPAAQFQAPDGTGMFRACQAKEKDGKGAARYDLADYLEPRQDGETMARLLGTVEGALAPQGWRFRSVPVADSLMPDPVKEKLYVWQAAQHGLHLQLTLHDAAGGQPAAGYLDVLTGCQKFGTAQKPLLAEYRNGDSRDRYRPTTASPQPMPTGPTTGP